jgi:hypothetical protein
MIEQVATHAADQRSAVAFCQGAPNTDAQRLQIAEFQQVQHLSAEFGIMIE